MPALKYKPVKTVDWKGLRIAVENPAGSVRKGVSKTGKKWQVEMPWDYGYVEGCRAVDGDELDVFLGPNKAAPNVFLIHQLKKESGEFDEQKAFLGFTDLMEAKEAYRKAYDLPDLFMGTWNTLTFETFKQKCLEKNDQPHLIQAATRMNTVLALFSETTLPLKVGDPVKVDGLPGRGVIIGIRNGRATVRFRSGEYVSRSLYNLHKITSDYVSPYFSGKKVKSV